MTQEKILEIKYMNFALEMVQWASSTINRPAVSRVIVN